MKIPLPWLQLTHEKVRFIVALARITFADILMFMQLGFQEALFDSSVRLHKSLETDIVILGSKTDTFVATKPFSRRRLYEVAGLEGVKSVSPVYLNFAFWKNPVKRNTRGILILGINPAESVINLPGVKENLSLVELPDVVLFDRKSRLEFGPIVADFEAGKQVKTEVANRQIKVGGLFAMGTSFGADGNIITSDVNFRRIFPTRNMGLIDMGLIRLEEGVNKELALEAVRKALAYEDVRVFSKEEFLAHEKYYWRTRTAIGFIFSLGTIMGFIVGIVIVYQILYTDVADHLPEYATLKAMGYRDIYLLTLIFQEAIILAVIGFLPGFALSGFLYYNAAKATGLPIMMTQARAITVLLLTVIMCIVSGAIAVGKLRSADPADIV
jgi:putative ABC transport system permease protein